MTSDDLFPWFMLLCVIALMAWLGVAIALPVATDVYDALGAIR